MVLASVAISGCADVTELVVVTDSDLDAPAELDALRFEVVGPSGEAMTREAPLTGQGAVALPVTLVVQHGGGALGPIGLRAVGTRDGTEVVRRDAVAWFVEGRSVLVHLDLSRACRDTRCPDGATCVDGVCVDPPEVRPDAGTPIDAGGAPDAGPECPGGCECVQSCEGGCECRDGCSCALGCAPGEDCMNGKCKDEGTSCDLSARGASNVSHVCERTAACAFDVRDVSNVDEITCKSGARCEVDCTGASNCYVGCEGDAECLVDCTDTSSCRISHCGELDDGDLRSCGDGVLVCRRDCP